MQKEFGYKNSYCSKRKFMMLNNFKLHENNLRYCNALKIILRTSVNEQ